ncbi:hypothetical protein ES703_52607 [subsurface metagenome]
MIGLFLMAPVMSLVWVCGEAVAQSWREQCVKMRRSLKSAKDFLSKITVMVCSIVLISMRTR